MSDTSNASLHNLKTEVDIIENVEVLPEFSHVTTGESMDESGQNDISYCEEIIICEPSTLVENMEINSEQLSNEIDCLDPLYIPTELEVPPLVTIEGDKPGTVKYVWCGHVYSREGNTETFICSNRQVNQCKGRIVVRNGKPDEIAPHGHGRIMSKVFAAEIAKKSMLRRAQIEPSVSLRDIYEDAYYKTPGLSSIYSFKAMMKMMMVARYGKIDCGALNSTPITKPASRLKFDIGWAKDWAEVMPGRSPKIMCTLCQEYIFSPSSAKLVRHIHSKLHLMNERIANGLKQKRNRQDDSESTDNNEKWKRPKIAESLVLRRNVENELEIAVEPLQHKRKEEPRIVSQNISQNKRRDEADCSSRYPLIKEQDIDDHLLVEEDLVVRPLQKRKEDPRIANQKISQNKRRNDADCSTRFPLITKQDIDDRVTDEEDLVELPQQKRKEDPRISNQKISQNKRRDDADCSTRYPLITKQDIVDHVTDEEDLVELPQQKRKEDPRIANQKISQNKRRDEADCSSRYPLITKQEIDDDVTDEEDLVELPQQKRKEDTKDVNQKTLPKKHHDEADHLNNNNEKSKKQEIVTHVRFANGFVELPQQKRAESPRHFDPKLVEQKLRNDIGDNASSINYETLGRQQIVNHMTFAKDFFEREQEKRREENRKNVEQKLESSRLQSIDREKLGRQQMANHMAFAEDYLEREQEKLEEDLNKMLQSSGYEPINYDNLRRYDIVNHMAFGRKLLDPSQQESDENSKNGEKKILEKKRRSDAVDSIDCNNSRRHDTVNRMAFGNEVVDPPQREQKRDENPKNGKKNILQKILEENADYRINYEKLMRKEVVDHPTSAKELLDTTQQKRDETTKNVEKKVLEKKQEEENDADCRINYEKLKTREVIDRPTFAKEIVDPPQRKREESSRNEDQKILRKKCQDDGKHPNIYVKLRRQDIADYMAYKNSLTEKPQKERKEDPKKAKEAILEKDHSDDSNRTKNDVKLKEPNITECSASEKHLVEPPRQKNQKDTKNANQKILIDSSIPHSISQVKVKTEPTISAQVDSEQNISTESSTAQSMPQIQIKTENISKPTLSVQVFEPSTGQASSGLEITLHMLGNGVWNFIDKRQTDRLGICSGLTYGENADAGFYKLNLDTYSYYNQRGQKCLYPYIEIPFEVENAEDSFDFRIQLSPFAYNICGNSKS